MTQVALCEWLFYVQWMMLLLGLREGYTACYFQDPTPGVATEKLAC